MVTVTLDDAQAGLDALIDRVEAGETIVITRDGRAVAEITPAARDMVPIPLEDLAAFRATMRPLRRPSAELLREMREDGA